jgi:hypothetical protein
VVGQGTRFARCFLLYHQHVILYLGKGQARSRSKLRRSAVLPAGETAPFDERLHTLRWTVRNDSNPLLEQRASHRGAARCRRRRSGAEAHGMVTRAHGGVLLPSMDEMDLSYEAELLKVLRQTRDVPEHYYDEL